MRMKQKIQNYFFYFFFSKRTSNIILELNDNFSEDFFEVLHISVGQNIKISENCPDFLTFSASVVVSKIVKF